MTARSPHRALGTVALAAAIGVAVPSVGGAARATPVAVRTVFVGGAPDRVAVSGAAVWVGDLGHLARVDVASGHVLRITGATTPIGVGADQVWAGVLGQYDEIARLDPTTARVVARVDVGGAPAAIAVGQGAVWVLDSDAVLTRIDPATNAVTATHSLGGMEPAVARGYQIGALGFGLAVGDGAVWASGRTLDNAQALLWRVDPATGSVDATVPTAANCASLAATTNAVWAACGTAQRVDTTNDALVDSGTDALDGLAVLDGAAWALGRTGTVMRLDATTGQPGQGYVAPTGSESVAAGDGALWLAAPHLHDPSLRSGTLVRLAVPEVGA